MYYLSTPIKLFVAGLFNQVVSVFILPNKRAKVIVVFAIRCKGFDVVNVGDDEGERVPTGREFYWEGGALRRKVRSKKANVSSGW